MSYFDTYKNRVQHNGNSYAERQRNNIAKDILRKFKKSPSYVEADVIDLDNNITNKGIQIFDDNSLSKLNETNSKKVIMQPDDELKVGYRFKCLDKEWICIKKDELISDKGIVKEMDTFISWFDKYNNLNKYSCVSEDATLYSTGITEGKIVTIDGMLKLTLPDNKYTRSIEQGQRIVYKNAVVYEVTHFNLSKDGLIVLTLDRTEKNLTTDNLTLGIADYYNRPEYTIQIQEDDISIARNSTLQLHAIVTKDGLVVNEEVEWVSSDINVAMVDGNGLLHTTSIGNCVVSAKLKGNNDYSDTINCNVVESAPANNIDILIQGDDSIQWTVSKFYKAVKMQNGIEIPTNFIFTLDYMGNPQELCNLNIINGNTCYIIANDNQLTGNIKLIAVNVLNSQEYYIKPISIIGYW